ncbi:VOC family protein [Vibrio sonorensis]|uniref:VOC family protein n=1 Tax=Vibrio sonorensis TaxID=1004316 RepID=UPI0008DAA869|nr:VOC family protein [Vibrio sonorensis]
MKTYVEHANLTVVNLDRTVDFLQTALPDFFVRHQGENSKRWCHIGTDDTYLALQEIEPRQLEHVKRTPYFDTGINHIGLVVENAKDVERRLTEAGYQQNGSAANELARIRVYFYDRDGIEWEFIQYTSQDSASRNDYQH